MDIHVVERQTPENQAHSDLEWQPLRGPFTRWPRISETVLVLVLLIITIGSWMSWVNDNPEVNVDGAALVLVAVEEFYVSQPAGDSIFSLLIAFIVWYVGRRVRIRGEYLRLLQERASHLEREQVAEADKAVTEERTRIARELHDIVAHQVSLMTVQAGAAKTVARQNPEAALQSMESVEKAGRQALNELRHLVSVLRPGDKGGGATRLPGSGHGIVGMRERAQLLGGNLLAAPLSGGGFKVVAYLPTSREEL
jgi:signal transduction histidine kinase